MRSIRGNEIALIFQEPMTSFSAHYTVGNQIIEAIRLHQPLSEAQARAASDRAAADGRHPAARAAHRRYPFQLSGGMRQRAMIAMALSCDPKMLIADEPTTALDVTTQAQILDLLRKLQQQSGMAIMLITHDMGVIAEMADDVAVMYLGRVVETGPVDEIFHAPSIPTRSRCCARSRALWPQPRTKLPTISGTIPHPYNRPTRLSVPPALPELHAGHLRSTRSRPWWMSAITRRQAAFYTTIRSARHDARKRHKGNRRPGFCSRSTTCGSSFRFAGACCKRSSGMCAPWMASASTIKPGRDAGAGRRERLRQDDHLALHPARGEPDRGGDPVQDRSGHDRSTSRRSQSTRCARSGARCR